MVNRKNKFKKKHSNAKRKPQRQRKTYSIYANKATQENREAGRKRKFKPQEEEPILKQPKVEENESSSDEEEEAEDPMKQLRETFGGSYLKKVVSAIESSESEDSESEDEGKVSYDEKHVEHEETELKEEDDESDTEEPSAEEETAEDGFSAHLLYDLSENMLRNLKSVPVSMGNFTENWPALGKLSIQIPKCEEVQHTVTGEINISGEQKRAAPGKVPTILKNKERTAAIKVQIRDNVAQRNVNGESAFTPLQNEVFSVINNYQDFFYPQRTFANAEELRFVYCVHVVNHVLKTRTKVLHHNARLNKKDDVPEDFRDQGLVRPKVSFCYSDSSFYVFKFGLNEIVFESKSSLCYAFAFSGVNNSPIS